MARKPQPWHALADHMRSQGHRLEDIALACDRAEVTVYRYFNPAYAERQQALTKAWHQRNRANDPDYWRKRKGLM